MSTRWRRWCTLIIGLAVGLAAGQAGAHDVWITTAMEGESLRALVHHGHPGDRKTPDPDKLFECDVVTASQQRRSLLPKVSSAVRDGVPVLLTEPVPMARESGVLILAARYDNGYWVKLPFGHRNTSKRQVPDAAESLSSLKYAKALVQARHGRADGYRMIVGHRLELVPLENPFAVSAGDGLKVLVLFDGHPLAGALVEIGDGVTPMEEKDIPRYTTDERGVAVLPLGKPGLQLIVVDHVVPSSHPDLAARELHNATLSFVSPLLPIP